MKFCRAWEGRKRELLTSHTRSGCSLLQASQEHCEGSGLVRVAVHTQRSVHRPTTRLHCEALTLFSYCPSLQVSNHVACIRESVAQPGASPAQCFASVHLGPDPEVDLLQCVRKIDLRPHFSTVLLVSQNQHNEYNAFSSSVFGEGWMCFRFCRPL